MARSKGAGSLVRRGRYWQCKIVVDGVPHYKATGTASKVEARKILDEFVRPFQAGSDVERLEAVESRLRIKETEAADNEDDYSNVRIEFMLDRYYATANAKAVSGGTRDNYEKFVDKFVRWLSEAAPKAKKIKDVDKALAERFLEYLKPSVSAGYFNGVLALFRKVWKEFARLSRHRCFSENPWDGYRYKGADLPVKRPLSAEEVQRVFQAVRDPETRLLFKLGLYTGLRKGDCCTLKWSDLDFERRTVRLIPMKTKKYGRAVTIPMHPILYAELDSRRRCFLPSPDRDGYVSPELERRYRHRDMASVKRAFTDAGIKTEENGRTVVSFHSLRHTFVSMSVSAGIPLDVVRQITGHSSLRMAEHYSHATDEALAKAVNAIPSVGAPIARKALVEVSTEIIGELAALGLGVEDALKEFIDGRKNTVDVETAA